MIVLIAIVVIAAGALIINRFAFAHVNANEKAASEKRSINAAARTVASDVHTIDSEVANLQGEFSLLQGILQAIQSWVQMAQQGAKTVTSDVNSDPANACADAFTVQSDAHTAQDEMHDVQGDVSTENTFLSTLRKALSIPPSDWLTYEEAVSVLPSYTSVYAITLSQERTAIAQGSQEISRFVT